MINLDLRNQTITLGELLQNPKAKAVLQKRFGKLLSHPLIGSAKKMSLKQLIQLSEKKLSKETIEDILIELKNV